MVAFKTWSAGDVLTAADVNTYLGKQAVIVCTSGTRPAAPVEGMTVYETDTDVYSVYSGTGWVTAATVGAWTDYSASLQWTAATTNPAIGNGSIVARYALWGKQVVYAGKITMGSTTTFGSGVWSITLPVSARSNVETGAAMIFDASASTGHRPAAARLTTTFATIVSTTGNVDATNPIAWATSDELRWSITYEAV